VGSEMCIRDRLGCAGVVVLVAHAGRGWQLGRRLRALGALLVLVPVIGLVCLGAVRVRSGQWHFARLDKLHKGYSLGRREVVLEDVLYTTKTPAYRDDGTVDVATLVRVNFFKMARRNREVLCAAELVTGIGQALQVGGLLLLGAAVWSGRGRWRAWVGEPTHVLALTATLVLGAVYFRYVSNNYVFSARYALTLIVIWCLAMGSSWRVFSALRGWRRMAAWIGGGVALLWLVVEVIQPKDARFLPLRGTGEILRGMMPREARVVAAPGLLQVAYYAQRPFVMLPGQRRMDLATYVASTNGYVLINHHDAWQAGCIGELTSGLERVEVSLPSNRYYAFSVYRARAGRE
ncbi:MAG: hypothetical protein N2595_06770, partial [bacterium]|nr:hypothetical protein [bacterium]